MPFTLAADVRERPVAIDGAGTLGRRIASVFVAGGTDIRLHDVSSEQLEACLRFVAESTETVQRVLDVRRSSRRGARRLLRLRPRIEPRWTWSAARWAKTESGNPLVATGREAVRATPLSVGRRWRR
jgi:3-hydroxyacyl-CoA dehydrogenase, NAD binding domain